SQSTVIQVHSGTFEVSASLGSGDGELVADFCIEDAVQFVRGRCADSELDEVEIALFAGQCGREQVREVRRAEGSTHDAPPDSSPPSRSGAHVRSPFTGSR